MYQAWKRQDIYTKLQSENMMERHERRKHKWKNNIKIDLKGTGCEVIDLVNPAEDRVRWCAFVNTAVNLQVL
jgi:hypothetical protein